MGFVFFGGPFVLQLMHCSRNLFTFSTFDTGSNDMVFVSVLRDWPCRFNDQPIRHGSEEHLPNDRRLGHGFQFVSAQVHPSWHAEDLPASFQIQAPFTNYHLTACGYVHLAFR